MNDYLYVLDDFIRAKQKLKIAVELSETEDIESEHDAALSKIKRRKLAAKRHKFRSPTKEKNVKKILSKIPPLPEHPFKAPGKFINN